MHIPFSQIIVLLIYKFIFSLFTKIKHAHKVLKVIALIFFNSINSPFY